MTIWTLLFYLAAILFIVLFIPDLLPRCDCCKRVKPRVCFKIHRTVKLRFGYAACKSVCKKCCRQYNIKALKDLETLNRIRRKVKTDMFRDLIV